MARRRCGPIIPCCASEDERFIDPYERLIQHDEYDAREGPMNGLDRTKQTDRYTRKTLAAHSSRRPNLPEQAEDIKQPTLSEGVTFISKLDNDHDY